MPSTLQTEWIVQVPVRPRLTFCSAHSGVPDPPRRSLAHHLAFCSVASSTHILRVWWTRSDVMVCSQSPALRVGGDGSAVGVAAGVARLSPTGPAPAPLAACLSAVFEQAASASAAQPAARITEALLSPRILNPPYECTVVV